MAKATVTLLSGAIASIEGTKEEVKELLDFYNILKPSRLPLEPKSTVQLKPPKAPKTAPKAKISDEEIAQIINTINSCREAENIEKNILTKTNEANRVLLPLYVVHEYLDDAYGLTTVELSLVLSQLGNKVKVRRQNVLRVIARSSASKYFVTDALRRPGVGAHYKINPRGLQYLKSVIEPDSGRPAQES